MSAPVPILASTHFKGMLLTLPKRVRLHVGSGDHIWPGWTNCDLYAEADVKTDGRTLPFPDDYADEIQSIHFIEHVSRIDLDNMMTEWRRVLKPGGRLAIEVPCLDKMAQNIVAGEKNIRLTTLGLYGDPRDPRPGMMHQWGYSKAELTEVLRQCDFVNVTVKEPLFHVPQRDMRVEAVKP